MGVGMVLMAATLWGTMGVFARAAYDAGAEPLGTVSARAAIAFLGLGPLHLGNPRRLAVPLRGLPFFALFGSVSVALFYWLYFAALERVPVGIAAALLYTAPAFAVVLARWIFGEEITPRKGLVLLAALLGTLLVTGAGGAAMGTLRGAAMGTLRGPAGTPAETAVLDGAPSPESGEPGGAGVAPFLPPSGVLLGLGAGLTYALFTIFGKRASARYDAVRTVFWAMGFGALVLGILAPPWRVLARHPGAVAPILALSFLSTLTANLLYIGGLRRLEAGVASLLATVEPVVAALLGWLWLGERLGGVQVAGIGLIGLGAAALVRRTRRGTRAPG